MEETLVPQGSIHPIHPIIHNVYARHVQARALSCYTNFLVHHHVCTRIRICLFLAYMARMYVIGWIGWMELTGRGTSCTVRAHGRVDWVDGRAARAIPPGLAGRGHQAPVSMRFQLVSQKGEQY